MDWCPNFWQHHPNALSTVNASTIRSNEASQCEDYKHVWHVIDMCTTSVQSGAPKYALAMEIITEALRVRQRLWTVNSRREWCQISVQLPVGERVHSSNIKDQHLIGHTVCRMPTFDMCVAWMLLALCVFVCMCVLFHGPLSFARKWLHGWIDQCQRMRRFNSDCSEIANYILNIRFNHTSTFIQSQPQNAVWIIRFTLFITRSHNMIRVTLPHNEAYSRHLEYVFATHTHCDDTECWAVGWFNLISATWPHACRTQQTLIRSDVCRKCWPACTGNACAEGGWMEHIRLFTLRTKNRQGSWQWFVDVCV